MRTDRYKEEPVKKHRRPLKVMLMLILLLAAAIAATTAYFYYSAYNSLSVTFTEESPVIKYGEEQSSMGYVKDSFGEITPEDESFDTSVIGSGKMVYRAEAPVLGGLLTPSKDFVLNYTVVDTVPPLMLWSGDGTVLERGTEFDINSIIAYGDNADPAPQVNVDGKVNMNKNGNYPIHVTVSDASGNNTEWDLTVTVTDELPAYTNDSESTSFKSFVSTYKGKGRSFGIDVSAWQDDIDFKAVKKAGCEFVIIRIGYTHDGEITVDKRFHQNYEAAKAAGLKVGVYLYSGDRTEARVRAAAQRIMGILDGESLDLPIAFDWEDFGNYQNYNMSFYELNKLYDAFSDELSKSGYVCMLYGSKNYLENVWEKTDTRPVWLAHYIEKTDYQGPYMMWQASCTGKISGISGNVDMDILYNAN